MVSPTAAPPAIATATTQTNRRRKSLRIMRKCADPLCLGDAPVLGAIGPRAAVRYAPSLWLFQGRFDRHLGARNVQIGARDGALALPAMPDTDETPRKSLWRRPSPRKIVGAKTPHRGRPAALRRIPPTSANCFTPPRGAAPGGADFLKPQPGGFSAAAPVANFDAPRPPTA